MPTYFLSHSSPRTRILEHKKLTSLAEIVTRISHRPLIATNVRLVSTSGVSLIPEWFSSLPPILSRWGGRRGGGRLRASRLDRSSKNEKVMAHENSRARLQRRDTSRGKWLIVIMNKHYRGNCDIPATILAVTTSLTPTSPLSSSFLIPHLKCIESS